jgi:hypothetical protein
MAPSLARQQFRALVADVAARAKARLPESVNGRIESAVKLVLVHDVTPQADGSILVGSSTDPLKTYRLEGTSCECQDFTRGQAPEGWCQHRIAAGIAKRVQELLATPEPAPASDDGAPPDPTPQPVVLAKIEDFPAAPACPAPLFSLTLHGLMGGLGVMLTIRGQSAAEFQANVAAVRGLLDAPQPPESGPTPSGQGEGYCPVHHVAMKQTTKNGQSWWSHKTPDGWCKGK